MAEPRIVVGDEVEWIVPLWIAMNEAYGSARRQARSERVLYGAPAVLVHAWALSGG